MTSLKTAEPTVDPTAPPKATPVKYWAVAGGLMVAFIAYVLISWVTGPFWKEVPPGPTPLPGWMKFSMIAWQIIMPSVWLVLVYKFVITPFRREKRLTTDGLILLAGTTVFFQDPLASYFNNWLTYNAYLVNRGSWVNNIPGWMAFGEPGRMLVEPLLFTPAAHGVAWLLFARVGNLTLRATRARWPQISLAGLLGVLYGVCLIVSILLEGIVWMPFGIYCFPGGHLPALFPDAYHRYPLHEAVFFGAWGAAIACVYYFRNDRGETIVERGIETVKGGFATKSVLRLLAMIAILQLLCLAIYNVPTAVLAAHSATWPKDLQSRSYLTDGICGAGTDMACPGPGVPLFRGDATDHSGMRIGPNGTVTHNTIGPAVPFSDSAEDAFFGPLLRMIGAYPSPAK
jgi:Spirocyclase AveC-like